MSETEETKQTPEEETADLNKRVEAFNGELIPLLGKYKVGLGAVPFITRDGRIFARPQIFDDKKSEQGPAPDAPADLAAAE